MPQQFNIFDPLGIMAAARNQANAMATRAGLPPLPAVPGQKVPGAEDRRMVERERFPDTLRSRPSMITRVPVLPPQAPTVVEPRGYSRERGF